MANGLKLAAAVAVLSGLSSAASAAILYSQAPHTPGAAGGNGLSCFQGNLGDPNTTFDREVADDFTVPASGWNVNRVSANVIQFTTGDPNAVTGADIKFFQSVGGNV